MRKGARKGEGTLGKVGRGADVLHWREGARLWQHRSEEGERGTAERMDGGVFILTVFLKPVLHVLDTKKNYWEKSICSFIKYARCIEVNGSIFIHRRN